MLLLADRQAMRVVLRFLLVLLVLLVLLHPCLVLLTLALLLVRLLVLLLLGVVVRVRWFGVPLRKVGRFLLL
jgi:hypothetical protein